jgi:formate dehydrogenase gamma subunit
MAEDNKYLRFSVFDRIEHWVLTLSFTTLAITGLVQKYAAAGVSRSVISALSGVENVRVIHRVAAVLLMLQVVYHIGMVGYRLVVRRVHLTMLPGVDDLQVAIHAIQYNLGLRQDRPQQGRFTFEEKAEYWAVVWGTLIMVITGFILWNPIATARFLPGEIIPAAKAAHGAEAVLATLAIIVWHFYGVHVKIFNRSIFTGHLDEKEMLHEHPLELAAIKAGVAQRVVAEQAAARRRRRFYAVYGVLAAVLLVTIYWFVTFEQSAIITVPPAEDVVVFAPLTPTPFPTPPPTPTPRPTATPQPTPLPGVETTEPEVGVTWADVADLFEQQCAACHNEANAMGGVNLTDYQALLAGGASGPIVQPGDPAASPLVAIQEAGGHPGQFSAPELEQVVQWIEDGALEAAGAATAAPLMWTDVAGLFEERCVMCHNASNSLGGLDLADYQGALTGGESGPVVVPGDSSGSTLVEIQEAGDHPGQFTVDELQQIRQWIADGALGDEAPSSSAPVRWADVASLFEAKCTVCHSEANALGGLNLEDYAAALTSVEPGDPAASRLIAIQEAGGHPGQLSEEELEQVSQWIADGAEQ